MSAMTRIAGRYELLRPLGHGAMATVDLVHDVELDRQVALKRLAENLARDEELERRFLREARLAARLAHPNVVRVFDVGEDDGRPFIAMEYVEGETLAELIARRGRLPAAEAARLGTQMCAGLAAAHAVDGHVVVADPFSVVERKNDPGQWASVVRENLARVDELLALGGHPVR